MGTLYTRWILSSQIYNLYQK